MPAPVLPGPSPLEPNNPTAFMRSILDAQGRQQVWDTLGGAAMGLLKASAPSREPMDFGTVFGSGIAGALEGSKGGEDRALKRVMTGAQLMQMTQKLEDDEQWRKALAGGEAGKPSAGAGGKPAAPAASPPVGGGFQRTLGGYESANNPRAVNPTSGAAGQFQFMPPTWQQMRAQHPDLNLPESPTAASPELQAEVEKRFRAGNAQSLQMAGLPVTPATLYLAHRVGAEGAKTLLQADPAAPMHAIVPPKWVEQNPDMRGTVGDFIAQAQQRFPSEGPTQPAVPPPLGGQPGVQPAQYSPQSAVPGMPAGGPPGMPAAQPPGAPAGGPMPPQMPAPPTLAEVMRAVPPAARAIIGAAGREKGLPLLMKYADPESVPAFDLVTKQVVFAPKTALDSGRYAPVEGQQLAMQVQKEAREALNSKVVPGGPGGQGQPNQPLLEFDKGVSAAQGTDPDSKIRIHLAEDAIKRNAEWQKEGLMAQSARGQLNQLQSLLDQITTGRFTGTTTQVKAAAKSAGFDLEAMGVKDDVGPAQAAAALTSLMALDNRRLMPGPMSDGDRSFLMNAGPSITNDPAGNKILIAVKRGDLQRQVDIAKYAREYIKTPDFKARPEGLDDYVNQRIAEKNYYDTSVLRQSAAPPGAIPSAPPGAGGPPAPPPGFKRVP